MHDADGVKPDPRAHWDEVYRTKVDAQLSWHQDEPKVSLELVRALAVPNDHVIDVGGGCSVLACRLANDGFAHVTVLDIAPSAVSRAQVRCGAASERIHWVVGDVTQMHDLEPVDLWHDRAVFHFLTEPLQRERYIDVLRRTLRPGGHAIIATFALDGPEQCSGLPVMRYDAAALERELGVGFRLIRSASERHITPWGRAQAFSYAAFQRVDTISAHDAGFDEIRTG